MEDLRVDPDLPIEFSAQGVMFNIPINLALHDAENRLAAIGITQTADMTGVVKRMLELGLTAMEAAAATGARVALHHEVERGRVALENEVGRGIAALTQTVTDMKAANAAVLKLAKSVMDNARSLDSAAASSAVVAVGNLIDSKLDGSLAAKLESQTTDLTKAWSGMVSAKEATELNKASEIGGKYEVQVGIPLATACAVWARHDHCSEHSGVTRSFAGDHLLTFMDHDGLGIVVECKKDESKCQESSMREEVARCRANRKAAVGIFVAPPELLPAGPKFKEMAPGSWYCAFDPETKDASLLLAVLALARKAALDSLPAPVVEQVNTAAATEQAQQVRVLAESLSEFKSRAHNIRLQCGHIDDTSDRVRAALLVAVTRLETILA